MIRWTLTTFILISLRDYNGFQIITLLSISVIFQSLIIIGKPTNQFDDNLITFLNEIFVSIYLYLLMMLTDFMGENTVRDSLGNTLVGLVSLGVIINLLKLTISIILDLRSRCRLNRLKQERDRILEEREKEKQRVERIKQIYSKGSIHLKQLYSMDPSSIVVDLEVE
jgi:hypothetical protein